MIWFELLPNGRLGIRFPYSKERVEAIRALPDRQWNKEAERWEVPLSSLKDVSDLFEVPMEQVPKTVRDAFESSGGGKTVLSIENTFTRIAGSDLPMEALDEATSFWVEGAEFSKQYQDGYWDGNHRLMRKRGGITFPTGLLALVERTLLQAGHDYTAVDLRVPPAKRPPLPTHGPAPRDYQRQVLTNAAKTERGVLQLATGAGKTLVAAHVIAANGLRSLFFVHTKDLLFQTIQVLESILQVPIGQAGDGRIDLQPITVATIQTAARALDVKLDRPVSDEVPLWKDDAAERLSEPDREAVARALEACELVIFDECHHLPAESFYEIAMKLPNAFYRYGLSATPWRSDRSDLMIEAALGPKLCVVTSSELIKRGYLVPPKITMIEVLPTYKRMIRDYKTIYRDQVVEHPERNALIAEVAAHSMSRGRSVLILVNQVKHGKLLEKMVEGAVFINGKDTSEVRNAALEQLRRKTHPILIATTLADEGLDLPSLDVLILAGAGKSETRALQRVGRVLRPHPGKTGAVIVDFWDQALYLEDHSKQRYEIYRTEPGFDVEIRPPKKGGKPKPRQRILAEN
jgi:superfamily II DNA or RNA helicase